MFVNNPTLNPSPDGELANSAAWARDVLHVYNDNYLGIRAAASALPGQKLVLPNGAWVPGQHLEAALALVDRSGCSRVVFHGMSTALYEFASTLRRMRFGLPLFGVWHGGPSQWVDHHETLELARFLRLDDTGTFSRSHLMQQGSNGVLRHPAVRHLVNSAPVPLHNPSPAATHSALVPAPRSMHKNLFGNLWAAELCPRIARLEHYADISDFPRVLSKSVRIQHKDAIEHQRTLLTTRIVLNASTMDCHSMVDLEAAAMGRPSIHRVLNLGVLDAHPLSQVATIVDSGSIQDILDALNRVLDVPCREMYEICRDYAQAMTGESVVRLEEFLYA